MRQSLLTALSTERDRLSILTFGAEASFLRASVRALRRSLGFSPMESPMTVTSPSPNLANLPSPRLTPYFPAADFFAPAPKTSAAPALFAPLPSPHSLQTALSIAESFLAVGLAPAERAGSGAATCLSWRTSRGAARTFAPWSSWRVWEEPTLQQSGPGAALRTGDVVTVKATWRDLSRPLERALRSRRIGATRLELLHPRVGARLRVLAVFRVRGTEWLAAAMLDAHGEDAEVGLLPVSCCVGGAGIVEAELHESASGFVASTWTSDGQLVWLDGLVNGSSIEWCRHGSTSPEQWSSVRQRASCLADVAVSTRRDQRRRPSRSHPSRSGALRAHLSRDEHLDDRPPRLRDQRRVGPRRARHDARLSRARRPLIESHHALYIAPGVSQSLHKPSRDLSLRGRSSRSQLAPLLLGLCLGSRGRSGIRIRLDRALELGRRAIGWLLGRKSARLDEAFRLGRPRRSSSG